MIADMEVLYPSETEQRKITKTFSYIGKIPAGTSSQAPRDPSSEFHAVAPVENIAL